MTIQQIRKDIAEGQQMLFTKEDVLRIIEEVKIKIIMEEIINFSVYYYYNKTDCKDIKKYGELMKRAIKGDAEAIEELKTYKNEQ